MIYQVFQQLERYEVYREVIMIQKPQTNSGIFSLFGLLGSDAGSNNNVELLKQVDSLLRHIPFQLNEIESRADLCAPMLKHISDIQVKVKEPVLILQIMIKNLNYSREQMVVHGCKATVENFVQVKCDRDSPTLPNQAQPPTQHEILFGEINSLVATYKPLEFEIQESLSTPFKLMYLFRGAKNYIVSEFLKHNPKFVISTNAELMNAIEKIRAIDTYHSFFEFPELQVIFCEEMDRNDF